MEHGGVPGEQPQQRLRRGERHARVLRRRLAFLAAPASFFHEDGRPVRAAEAGDRYRKGMLLMARAQSKAERDWLTGTLAELEA